MENLEQEARTETRRATLVEMVRHRCANALNDFDKMTLEEVNGVAAKGIVFTLVVIAAFWVLSRWL